MDSSGWVADRLCSGKPDDSDKSCEKACGLCGNWFLMLVLNVIGLAVIWYIYFDGKAGICAPSAVTRSVLKCSNIPDFLGIVLLDFFVTSLIAAPMIRFIHGGWYTRYEEFRNRLTGRALEKYLIQYWEKKAILGGAISEKLELLSSKKASAVFENIYSEHYGRKAFRVPNVLLVMIVFVEASLLALGESGVITFTKDFPLQISIAALSGAYMFVVSDMVMLVRRRCLNITDVYWYVLRMLLAIPIALSVGGGFSANPSALTFGAAFTVCFLPVDVLVKQIRRIGSKNLGDSENQQNTDIVLNLEGVTVPISAMLLAEGVNSVDQLIGMDPVLLSIRTGLPFKFVLNLISQAVVRRHLGIGASGLVPLDLATCEQIKSFVERLDKEQRTEGGPMHNPTGGAGPQDDKKPDVTPTEAPQAASGPQQGDAAHDAASTSDCAVILDQAASNMNAVLSSLSPRLSVNAQSIEQAFRCITADSFSKFLTTKDLSAVAE